MSSQNFEITLYINKMKSFLEDNPDIAHYFFDNDTAEIFFRLCEKYAEENFNETGLPNLSIVQLHAIKFEIKYKHTNVSKKIVNTTFISPN